MVSRSVWGSQRRTTNKRSTKDRAVSKKDKNKMDSSVNVGFNVKQIHQPNHVDTQILTVLGCTHTNTHLYNRIDTHGAPTYSLSTYTAIHNGT